MERSIDGGDFEKEVDWRTQVDDLRWSFSWQSEDDEPNSDEMTEDEWWDYNEWV